MRRAARQQAQTPGICWLLRLLLLLCFAAAGARAQLEPPGVKLSDQLLKRYLSNAELAAWMQEYAHKCANISRVLSIGKSAEGHDLWVLEISDKPGQAEGEPAFKYVANMHGDEPSGRVLLPQLAEWLCANQASDARAARLITRTHIFLMPTMNPDGFALHRRANARGADLNRDFPDPVEQPDWSRLAAPRPNAQPETKAVMDWMLKTRFTASANLHEGAVCANYPFDGYSDHSEAVNGTRAPAPDDATFVFLAKTYASAHKTMAASKEFKDGITNGAQWYPVYRGMQDWAYLAAGCFDITLELSDDKWRRQEDLPQLWEENRDALLALPLAAVLGGVQGTVTSADGRTPLAATIIVEGVAHNTSSEPQFGYFNRPLAPGDYIIVAVAPGHEPATAEVTVPKDGSGAMQYFSLPHAGRASAQPPPTPAQQPQWPHHSFIGALRPHHVFGLAVLGVCVCGVGGIAAWSLLKRTRGGGSAARGMYSLLELQRASALERAPVERAPDNRV